MADKLKASVLILSDLHFGTDLLREAEIPPLWLPWWKNRLAPGIRRYMQTRWKSHDIVILMSLPLYLKRLVSQLRSEGFERSDFDLYLILGDLSTFANGASYSFLCEYLSKRSYTTHDFPKIPALRIPLDRLVAIPGNHDKMLRTDLQIFANEFASKLHLGEPRPKSSFFVTLSVGDLEFLFILVDAGIYATTEGKLDLSAREHLAKGAVPGRLKAEIKNKLNSLRKGEPVDKAAPRNYARALKVLLVHYAVDDQAVLGLAPHGDQLLLPHACEGLDDLVGELRQDLHLVIHGHLHRPKVYNHKGVQVISATTTSQKKEEYNGFFVVKIFESGDVFTEYHKWNTNGFSKVDDQDLNARILNLSGVRTLTTGAGGPGI